MLENTKKEMIFTSDNQVVVSPVINRPANEFQDSPQLATPPNNLKETTTDQPNSPFQVFLREQERNSESVDNFLLRQMWLEMSTEAKRVYTEKWHVEQSQETQEPLFSVLKTPDGKSTKFSQYSLKNIVKMDSSLENRLSKDAFNAVLMSVDLFTAEIIKGSENEMKKMAAKKKALKAEHLYKFISNQSYRFWFCKDLREEYAQQKELKQLKTAQKRETEKEKSAVKEKPSESNKEVKRITDFFGGGKKSNRL